MRLSPTLKRPKTLMKTEAFESSFHWSLFKTHCFNLKNASFVKCAIGENGAENASFPSAVSGVLVWMIGENVLKTRL